MGHCCHSKKQQLTALSLSLVLFYHFQILLFPMQCQRIRHQGIVKWSRGRRKAWHTANHQGSIHVDSNLTVHRQVVNGWVGTSEGMAPAGWCPSRLTPLWSHTYNENMIITVSNCEGIWCVGFKTLERSRGMTRWYMNDFHFLVFWIFKSINILLNCN